MNEIKNYLCNFQKKLSGDYKDIFIKKIMENSKKNSNNLGKEIFFNSTLSKNEINLFETYQKFNKRLYEFDLLNLIILCEKINLVSTFNYENIQEKEINIIEKIIFKESFNYLSIKQIRCSQNINSNNIDKILGMYIPTSKIFYEEFIESISQYCADYLKEEQNLRNYIIEEKEFFEFQENLLNKKLTKILQNLNKSNLIKIFNDNEEIKNNTAICDLLLFDYLTYFIIYSILNKRSDVSKHNNKIDMSKEHNGKNTDKKNNNNNHKSANIPSKEIVQMQKDLLMFLILTRFPDINEKEFFDKIIIIVLWCESHSYYINLLINLYLDLSNYIDDLLTQIKNLITNGEVKNKNDKDFYNNGFSQIFEAIIRILNCSLFTLLETSLNDGDYTFINLLSEIESKSKILETALWLSSDELKDFQISLRIINTLIPQNEKQSLLNILNILDKNTIIERKILKENQNTKNLEENNESMKELFSSLENQIFIFENNLKDEAKFPQLMIKFLTAKYLKFNIVEYRKKILLKILNNNNYIIHSIPLLTKYLSQSSELNDFFEAEEGDNNDDEETENTLPKDVFFEIEKNVYLNTCKEFCEKNILIEECFIHILNYKFYKLIKNEIEYQKSFEYFAQCLEYSIGYLLNELKTNKENPIIKIYSISYIKIFLMIFINNIYDKTGKITEKYINRINGIICNNTDLHRVIKIYILKLFVSKINNYETLLHYNWASIHFKWISTDLLNTQSEHNVDFFSKYLFYCHRKYTPIVDFLKEKSKNLFNLFDNSETQINELFCDKHSIVILFNFLVNNIKKNNMINNDVSNDALKNAFKWINTYILSIKTLDLPVKIRDIFSCLLNDKIFNSTEKNPMFFYSLKIILIFALTNRNCWFNNCLSSHLFELIECSFLPGIKKINLYLLNVNKIIELLKDIDDQTLVPAVYICQCGTPYKILDETIPDRKLMCLKCGRIIGVINHIPRNKNIRIFKNEKHRTFCLKYYNKTKEDIPSKLLHDFISEYDQSFQVKGIYLTNIYDNFTTSKIGNINRLSNQICQFLIFDILYFGQMLNFISQEEIDHLFKSKNISTLKLLEDKWKILENLLAIYQIDNIYIFLNLFMKELPEYLDKFKDFEYYQSKEVFENTVESIVTKDIANYPKFKERYYEYITENSDNSLYAKLYEIENLNSIINSNDHPYYSYFRIENLVNKNDLKLHLMSCDGYITKYPVLSHYLLTDYKKEFKDLENIILINPFSNFLIDNYSNIIQRNYALNQYTINSFKDKVLNKNTTSEDQVKFKEMISNFLNGYNKFINKKIQYITKNIDKIQPLTRDSKLSYCLNESESDGLILAGIYDTMKNLQNEFFDSVLSCCNEKSYARSFVDKTNDRMPIQRAEKKDLLSLTIKDELDKIESFKSLIHLYSMKNNIDKSKNKIIYSEYNNYYYDLDMIEEIMTNIIFSSKKRFYDEQIFFAFAYEGNVNNNSQNSIFTEYLGKYPQDELTKEIKKYLTKEYDKIKISEEMNKILFSLQKLLCFCLNENFKRHTPLSDIMDEIPNFPVVDKKCYSLFKIKEYKFNLTNAFSCYEFIEELLAKYFIENISNNFCIKFSDNEKRKSIYQSLINFKYNHILKDALRRFISRYLNYKGKSEYSKIYDKSLIELLISKKDIWPSNCEIINEIYYQLKLCFNDIPLKNIKAFYELLTSVLNK